MPEPLSYTALYLRSPRLIFLSFGFLYLTLVWTSPILAPLYLLLFFLVSAFYLSFLFPTGREWGDQRRTLLHLADTRTPTPPPAHVKHTRRYIITSRGTANYTQQWTPSNPSTPLRAIIVILHGYADHTSGFKQAIAHWLVGEGYHVVGMDYPGHGRSDGLHVAIESFEPILEDVMQFIGEVKEAHPKLPIFLFSESMGGAVAFLLSTRFESTFAGTIFVAPMCQIADEMIPPNWVIQALVPISHRTPHLPITPTHDVADMTFKRPEVSQLVKQGAVFYWRLPRLATAANLFFTSLAIGDRLHELRLPFLICHGEIDRVTDPKMSKRMIEEAASEDKTMKLYKGAWHSLLIGEDEDVMEKVRADIAAWLEERTTTAAVNGSGAGKR